MSEHPIEEIMLHVQEVLKESSAPFLSFLNTQLKNTRYKATLEVKLIAIETNNLVGTEYKVTYRENKGFWKRKKILMILVLQIEYDLKKGIVGNVGSGLIEFTLATPLIDQDELTLKLEELRVRISRDLALAKKNLSMKVIH